MESSEVFRPSGAFFQVGNYLVVFVFTCMMICVHLARHEDFTLSFPSVSLRHFLRLYGSPGAVSRARFPGNCSTFSSTLDG